MTGFREISHDEAHCRSMLIEAIAVTVDGRTLFLNYDARVYWYAREDEVTNG